VKKSSKLGVGARINLFDNSPQIVYDFDKLFPECPLPERFGRAESVIIGDVLPNNCREIWIDGENIKHKMFSDILYGIDRDLFHEDETEKELEDMYGHPV
jgi:hypothetical protein